MIVTATSGQWIELPSFRAARVVQKNRNQGTAIAISETLPTLSPYDENQDIYGILSQVGDSVEIDGVQQNSKVYVFASGEDAILSVNEVDSRTFPDGAFQGTRALTVQSYVEANSKSGVQHEGSTLLAGVAAGASNDTIFLTGSLPVALKGRIISYTGSGVSAFIYEGPTYTGGTPAAYENASAINPVVGLSQIIVGATVSVDGDLVFAPVHFIGNQSNQGQGTTANSVTGERLLKPNTAYLLRLTSLDDQPQDISSYLSWYEGELDLPLQ